MWITTKEMATEWGGKSDEVERAKQKNKLVKLPFNYCNLSLQPFKDPYCTVDGAVFDLLTIIPFIKKNEKNPISGEKLE